MSKTVNLVYKLIDKVFLRKIVKIIYKECPDNKNSIELLEFAFFQKILGFNRSVPWPVHISSRVTG